LFAGPFDPHLVEDRRCGPTGERERACSAGNAFASRAADRITARCSRGDAAHDAGGRNETTSRSIPTSYANAAEPDAQWTESCANPRAAFDGVISGSTVGITKLQFLQDDELSRLSRVQAAGPTQRRSTAASCCRCPTCRAPTAQLQPASGTSRDHAAKCDIKACRMRSRTACARKSKSAGCGDPRAGANLLYSPRDNILATSLLIEASCTRSNRRGVS